MKREEINQIADAVIDRLERRHAIDPQKWVTIHDMCQAMNVSLRQFTSRFLPLMPFVFRPIAGGHYRANRQKFEEWMGKVERGEIEIR